MFSISVTSGGCFVKTDVMSPHVSSYLRGHVFAESSHPRVLTVLSVNPVIYFGVFQQKKHFTRVDSDNEIWNCRHVYEV